MLRRYLDEVVHLLAADLNIENLMDWLRPYLVMRLLAVYPLRGLESRDTALSLALLADALNPATELADFLALTPTPTSNLT